MKRSKNVNLNIVLCFILGVLPIILLYIKFVLDKDTPNGFERIIYNTVLNPEQKHHVDLKYPGYYMAGFDISGLFLGNTAAPAHILRATPPFNDTTHINLDITVGPNDHYNPKSLKLFADKSTLYLVDGNRGVILEGPKVSFSPFEIHQIDSVPFSKFVPLQEDHGYIIKSYDPVLGQDILKKRAMKPPLDSMPIFVLDKQFDGVFCTDGMLMVTPDKKQIFHIYYYRNQIICLNQNLKTLYRTKTIDTISQAQVHITNLKEGTQRTFDRPPLRVNRKVALNDSLLLIHSALRADNENITLFNTQSVIDVYKVDNGDYHFSFYVPSYLNKKMNDFQLIGSFLFVLYDTHLVTYTLSLDKLLSI